MDGGVANAESVSGQKPVQHPSCQAPKRGAYATPKDKRAEQLAQTGGQRPLGSPDVFKRPQYRMCLHTWEYT